MIVCVAVMSPPRQEAIIGIRTQCVAIAHERAGCPLALRHFVDVGSGELMNGPVSDISNLEAHFPGKAAFHAQVPLPGVWHGIGWIDSTGSRGCRLAELGCG